MRAFLFYVDDYLSSKRVEMMDAHEERGYVRLLLRASSEPDCGLPNDDTQLAVFSLLGSQWNKPTKEKTKRIGLKTSGQKLRDCFNFRPPDADDSRIYNERLYREWNHQREVNEARKAAGQKGGRPRKPNGSSEETKRFREVKANGNQNETNDVWACASSFESEKTKGQPSFLDNGFSEFQQACIDCGLSFSDADMIDAQMLWGQLDFEQRLNAIKGLHARKECGEFDDPAYRPLPQNYLKKRIWNRALRDRKVTREAPAKEYPKVVF